MKDQYYATGKRKTSIARIFIKDGIGNIKINKLNIDKYCNNYEFRKYIIIYPLKITDNLKNFDILITVKGGGVFSQVNAIRHGISKVLLKYNSEYRKIFKENKLITRDSRKVERKKVGFKKSRKKPQFSKR